jgi:prevent-host-death family protein
MRLQFDYKLGGRRAKAMFAMRLVDSTVESEHMREIQASEAKVHLPQLLDEVERGETLIITRHGRRIARIVPGQDRWQEEIDRAIAGIREIQKRTGPATVTELLSARDEGRKY